MSNNNHGQNFNGHLIPSFFQDKQLPNNRASAFLTLKTDIQSQQSPLRTNAHFYVPANRASSLSAIKTYPDKLNKNQIKNLYAPDQNNKNFTFSTRKYLDTISRNRALQRRPLHKDEYYDFINLMNNNRNPEKIEKTEKTQTDQLNQHALFKAKTYDKSLDSKEFSTIRSRHSRTSSTSSILASFIDKQKSIIQKQLNQYHNRVASQVSEQKKKLNFTFYNSKQKLTKIYDNFYKVEHLQDRKTNLYQNNLKRKVDIEDLMKLLKEKERQQRKKGNL